MDTKQPIQTVYRSWFLHCPREFIDLLQFCNQHQVSHQNLLDKALYVNEICPGHVTGEKIMALLGNQPMIIDHRVNDHVGDEIENFANLQLEEIMELIHLKVEEAV